MIYLNNVSKIYEGGVSALEDVNLSVSPGEFVSIVGHSGAGKTTLIKMILAEETPTEGEVFFESLNVHKLRGSGLSRLRRRIGSVFQDLKLLSNKTAYENIAFAMEAAGKTNDEIKSDIPHVLELVDLSDKAERFPRQLSGGEQQKLAIARAIINQPELIIADEPVGSLDTASAHEVMDILKKINELGTTIILATHNKSAAEHAGKRIVTLEKGKITKDDKKGESMV